MARSDPSGILATPVTTLARDPAHDTDLDELARLVDDTAPPGPWWGCRARCAGREGPSAELARDYAEQLAERIAPFPVDMVDERLTTVSAQRKLHQNGVRGSKQVRAVIDQAAAVELLQHWLDTPDPVTPARTAPLTENRTELLQRDATERESVAPALPVDDPHSLLFGDEDTGDYPPAVRAPTGGATSAATGAAGAGAGDCSSCSPSSSSPRSPISSSRG